MDELEGGVLVLSIVEKSGGQLQLFIFCPEIIASHVRSNLGILEKAGMVIFVVVSRVPHSWPI